MNKLEKEKIENIIKNKGKKCFFIKASDIVVEERVRLNCMIGCEDYGRNISCPPFTPTPEEFRKISKQYSEGVIITEKVEARLSPEIAKHFVKNLTHKPDVLKEFFKTWSSFKKKAFEELLEIESEIFNLNYPLAMVFWYGTCCLCKECVDNIRDCRFPFKRRSSMEAVGINVVETLNKIGIKISFPFKNYPLSVSLILID